MAPALMPGQELGSTLGCFVFVGARASDGLSGLRMSAREEVPRIRELTKIKGRLRQ